LSFQKNVVPLLSSVPLFSGMKKKHLQAIAKAGKELSYEPGTTVVGEGEGGVGLYIILDGLVEVRRKGKVLARLGKGQFFGEMSLLDGKPRSADVVAVERTSCFGLTSWSFIGLVKTNPEIAVNLLKELAGRLRETNRAFTE